MITLYDGKPVPKVIDFGVAKATEQKLTERTLFTQYGTMVGTLEYMSPEQAEMNALGVDTRSDIYSLGVLLYELLTGSTPLSHKRVKEAAYAEVLRMIREEEPPKPSTRLSDSGEALASISDQRHMEPAKLTKLMRGELDWIVMKTLEKDRNRRYETAAALRRRRRAVSERRASAGLPAIGGVPVPEIRAAKQGRRADCGRRRAGSGARDRRPRERRDGAGRQQRGDQGRTKADEGRPGPGEAGQRCVSCDPSAARSDILYFAASRWQSASWPPATSAGPRSCSTIARCTCGAGSGTTSSAARTRRSPSGGTVPASGLPTFSPDGNLVASSSSLLMFGEVRIWDRRTGKSPPTAPGAHSGPSRAWPSARTASTSPRRAGTRP